MLLQAYASHSEMLNNVKKLIKLTQKVPMRESSFEKRKHFPVPLLPRFSFFKFRFRFRHQIAACSASVLSEAFILRFGTVE